MVIDLQQSKKLRALLPKNYATVIAAECGCSERTVYRVLNHGQSNSSVVEALIRLAKKSKEKADNLSKELNEL